MAGHWIRDAWRAAVVLVVATSLALADEQQPANPALADAQLTDICFASSTHGWAVGDRGLILHTSDGGRHWNVQNSPVECRLASVFFLDEKHGWAAGGFTQRYTQSSVGVIVRTRDGGQTWTLDRKLALPAIARIRFFDTTHGWALGQPSAYFPSGVYSTEDGGRSWAALPAAAGGSWLTGELIDPNSGALAGRGGALATIRRRGVEAVAADYGLRSLARMQLTPQGGGWLVGDGGLVLTTRDLGKSWQTTESDLPADVREQFDFAALALRGQSCWVAGTPGSRVLHTADGGRSWQTFDTGQSLPINALAFVDDQNGFAAGELGTLLATSDGGRTWRRAHGEHRRAAYLGVFSRQAELPLELFARLSAEEGYLAAVELLSREDAVARASMVDPVRQAQEAVALAGGSAASQAWRFPLRDAGLRLSAEQIVEGWNFANDGQSLDRLEAHVVSRLRMWRPNVVVTTSADVRGGDPLLHLVNQVVLRAVERAADPKQYPKQVSVAGLQPWKVAKVYAAVSGEQSGTTNVNTAQLSSHTGRTVAEIATAARGVISPDAPAPPTTVGFRLLVNQIPQQLGERDFFSGIPLSPGGEARRAIVESSGSNLEAAKREAQLRRNLQAILAQAEEGDRDGRFLADFGQQTKQLEPTRAAEVLVQLAQRYHCQGRWDLAAECYELVVERYPNSALATKALVWLVQYYASTETSWRMRADQQHTIQQVTALAPAAQPRDPRLRGKDTPGMQLAGGARRQAEIGARADEARGGGVLLDNGETQTRLEKACGYARQIEQLQPGLYGEPMVRFPLAVTHRQQGLPRQAERFYMALRHSRPADAWRACALGELWLADPKTESPKSTATCLRAPGKPRLDGRLDEPFWQKGTPIQLHSALRDDEQWGAVAMLAYDEEFLYLAVSCAHAPGRKYAANAQPRPRDPDLADEDRVEFLIDVDRDFATFYRLAIDSRGWPADDCWHDASWNPNWFVAPGTDEHAWIVEAAIPLSELTGHKPASKTAWALGIQRTVPGVGFQSWTQPASTKVEPEGFGYLIFE